MRLLNRFVKFIITTCLPFYRAYADRRRVQGAVVQTQCRLVNLTVFKEE
jgi:hypothetical protein